MKKPKKARLSRSKPHTSPPQPLDPLYILHSISTPTHTHTPQTPPHTSPTTPTPLFLSLRSLVSHLFANKRSQGPGTILEPYHIKIRPKGVQGGSSAIIGVLLGKSHHGDRRLEPDIKGPKRRYQFHFGLYGWLNLHLLTSTHPPPSMWFLHPASWILCALGEWFSSFFLSFFLVSPCLSGFLFSSSFSFFRKSTLQSQENSQI